ncbi:MAG: 16S rRNA (guanine(527)-N(7))-methyltransferase RsmG [Paracoccaceae bacterium]|jgi:16S rRNA (guanine527-N7)-methyltransferase|nr:16S rRNA (guanine(527)-N(7))-methyltransferase RsmG [Paracoccaceae bacterium]MDP7186152.1 16S rRNA (guanine(527)-N(7))-methyltransferase RsmG [Paracoccaceae bacterium]
MSDLNVSRETMQRLEHYLSLLKKWNPSINLVAKSTIDEAWTRHFTDSIQIYRHAPENWRIWADLGSGGGFPGAVIAIMAQELNPAGTVSLVESDQRKSTFLRTVFRETGVNAKVITQRIEATEPLSADIISARALAELTTLLEFAHIHGKPSVTCLFPKGESWEKELLVAQESWSFGCEVIKSETNPQATVLKVKDLTRA